MDFYADPPVLRPNMLRASSPPRRILRQRRGRAGAPRAAQRAVTTVSDDPVGRFCVNQLQRYGVGTDTCAW